ncbi:MAG: phasin family protein [Rhodospirillales bacterium]|nr:phasin family protein [Rhodospirillales bacterium]
MTARTERTASKVETRADDRMTEFPAPDLMKMTTTLMNGWTELNTHLLSFAQTSIRNNLDAAQELRNCQSPQEVLDTQMRVARKTYEDYLEEARNIGNLMARMSNDAVQWLSPNGRA